MSLPLPFCLFKFLEYPFNIPVDFKGKWKQSKKNLISTEPLKINIELIRNYEDILNIFPNAQFLNKNPHDSITKWGVFLSLFGKIFFQMKMIFFEKYVLILQITSEENNSEIVMRIKEEILANLEFILCE